MFFRRDPLKSDFHRQISHLARRLGVAQAGRPVRIVAFIAARAGEGTSTVCREYAAALAAETGQAVLLADAGPTDPKATLPRGGEPGILNTIAAGRPPAEVIRQLEGTLFTGRWNAGGEPYGALLQTIPDAALWTPLLERYGTIVIDAASLQHSFDGVVLAARAEVAVLVIEAEKTPSEVVRNLRNTLASAHATIAGVVMNKRRYYIPQRVYKRL